MKAFHFSKVTVTAIMLSAILAGCGSGSASGVPSSAHVNPADSNMGIQVNNNYTATIYPISSTSGDCPWVTTSPPYPVGAGSNWGTQLVYSTSCSPQNNGPNYVLTYGLHSTTPATSCTWTVSYTGGLHFSFSVANGADTDCTHGPDSGNPSIEDLNYAQTSLRVRHHRP